jgi:hypothetical protein
MRTPRIAAGLFVLVLAGCAGTAVSPAGGVQGSVTAGPTCPVEIQGSPCPPQPWTGTVRATSAGGSVTETVTDGHGHYTLHLPDGTYDVEPVVEGGPPTAKPVRVTVAGGAMQSLDLQVDTGIR